MATLISLRDLVKREIPAAPNGDIDFYMLRAARQFCQETWFCRRTIEITLVVDTNFYALVPTSNQERVIGIYAAEWRGAPLDPVREEELRSSQGDPTAFFYRPSNPGEFWPLPYPNAQTPLDEVVDVRCPIEPIKLATELPDDLLESHDDTLRLGAQAELFNLTQRPWYNPEEAARCRKEYNRIMMRAKGEAMRGWQSWNSSAMRRRFAIR